MLQHLDAAKLGAQLMSLLHELYPESSSPEILLVAQRLVFKYDRLMVYIAPRDADGTNGSIRLSSAHYRVDDYLSLTEWEMGEPEKSRIRDFLQWHMSHELNLTM